MRRRNVGVLAEHDDGFVLGDDLLDQLDETVELAGAAGELARRRRRSRLAGWLQICLSRAMPGEHVEPAPLGLGDLGDLVEHGARGRLVERDLLVGEEAVVAHDDALGELVDDPRVGLRAPADERGDAPAQVRESFGVGDLVARTAELGTARRTLVRFESRPGLTNDMMLHSSSRWFSTGVPVAAMWCCAVSVRAAFAVAVCGVLDRLGLVDDHPVPLHVARGVRRGGAARRS